MMFDLKRPCDNCPFRKGQGPLFRLAKKRLEEIFKQSAFQCHKTLHYETKKKPAPQQCAGLMSLLHKEGMPNQIMQIGQRLGAFDPSNLVLDESYDTIAETIEAHCKD